MSRYLRPLLLLSPLPFAGALAATYAYRSLASDYPDVPLAALPAGSFTRRVVEESEARGLARWAGSAGQGGKRDGYVACYCNYETTVPRRSLEAYGARLLQGPRSRPDYLAAAFTHAFFHSGLMSIERTLTRTRAPEAEARGQWAVGQEAVRGAIWAFEGASVPPASAAASLEEQQQAAAAVLNQLPAWEQPPNAPPPPTPAASALDPARQATNVFYWRAPPSMSSALSHLPWRVMRGGWHELLIDELPAPATSTSTTDSPEPEPEPMVRLVWTCVHVYDRVDKDDGKTLSALVRPLHETFSRALLGSAKRLIERG
ncbi:hypothetical protein CALCODRAFT_496804 [Calocera cornea HHB12733]|uniref:Uncharacterized protein n=1 Tax=Calocera cornea HHB12733 TaxID=1353952 RepID=A0A165FMT0_9BASI|nr:hypothetical protein CALCODRAFT_496804 [Calocera cornea HHB12733]